jgi:hypothetical protein
MEIGRVKDISAKSEELAVIPIYMPDGDPYLDEANGEPCTISVYGPESKASKKAKGIEWRQMTKRAGVPELEEHEASRIAKAAAHVGEWSGWKLDGGVPAPCTVANVRELLGAEHILAQVEAGIARHAAFLGARKTSSASS